MNYNRSREQILFLIQLTNCLPHYQTQSEPILFHSYLGEEVAKVIELQNPVNKQISYYARIDGCSDFTVE